MRAILLWGAAAAAVFLYVAPFALDLPFMRGVATVGGEQHKAPFPSKTITIMAPASPGGGWDQLARLMQHVLTTEKISPVSVEVVNKGGAGGTIGLAELITQHRADPYIMMVGGSTLVSALVMHDSRFNLSETDLIARLASEYEVVAVAADSPFQSFEQLLTQFKKYPESFIWGGGSAGSADHLLIGMIAREAGIDPSRINYVAYTGGGEAAAAVMGGQVAAGVAGYAEWKDLAAAGKMRLLAISAPKRFADVDVPVINEYGLNIVLENWRFVIAPPGIKAEERKRLVEMVTAMRNTEEWRDILKRYYWEDRFLTGPELDRFVADETMEIAKLLGALGLGALGERYAAAGPYVFPIAILIMLGLLGAGLAFRAVRSGGAGAAVVGDAAITENGALSWSGFALSAALILLYICSLNIIGFYFATPIFVILQARLIERGAFLRDLTVALTFTCAVYYLFENLLKINVP